MPKTPKYQKLVAWIRKQISEGKFTYGDKLYSENKLCEMFDISRQTVRQALGVLEQEGLLESRRGSGTYVSFGISKPTTLSMNIGVITTYIDSYIFPSIIKGIEGILTENNYSMQLMLTHNQVENEHRAITSMLEKNVDGIIIEPTKSGLPNPNIELYTYIKKSGIPLVFINAEYPNMSFPCVAMDDTATGTMATEHLIAAGHKSISGLFQSDDRQGHLRYAGYIKALKSWGLELNSSKVLWYSTEDIPYLMKDYSKIERCLHGSTAVFCYNDQIAVNLIRLLNNNGINIPNDLSVISVDNSELARMSPIPLTSVIHPAEKLGAVAANNILSLIVNPNFDAK